MFPSVWLMRERREESSGGALRRNHFLRIANCAGRCMCVFCVLLCKPNHQPIGGSDPNHQGFWSPGLGPVRCVFYYCRTYYKAVRVGGGGEWRTCAMRDDEPRPVWMSLPITHWFR
jgi:hypothetical protein